MTGAVDVPFDFETIPQLLKKSVERFGDSHAIEDGDTTLTFEALAEKVEEITRAVMAAGVKRGDRCAIWAPNVWEWVVAALGIHHAGGVLVPINTRFKGEEAAYVLEKSRARIALESRAAPRALSAAARDSARDEHEPRRRVR